jgi:glycosyltransferase involved in cell wall biosynthesis
MSSISDPAGAAPRVAQLVETLDLGGAETLAVRLANARAAAGLPACLYVLTGPGALSDQVRPDVKLRYLGYRWPSPRNPAAALASLRGAWRVLTGWIAADGVQVLQTHVPAGNFWGLFLARGRRCGTVATIHSTRELAYGQNVHPVRAWLRRRLYRDMLRRCGAVVAVSAGVRDALLAALGVDAAHAARLEVVPNGVEVPALPAPGRRAELRRRHGIEGEEPVLLAAGRLDPLKNYPVLLEALACLRDEGRPCRLVLAGEGPEFIELRDQAAARGIADRVRLPGAVVPLVDLLQAGDLFVQPSEWEGMPLALLEAMACGLPAIGTRVPGIRDLIVDGRDGLLVEPGDPAALAGAIARLLDDPDLARGLGAAGRARVAAGFSHGAMLERLEGIYRRVAP